MAAPSRSRRGRDAFFAWVYPRVSRSYDRAGGSALRRRLVGDVAGRVLEVGAGHGLNFAHYPETVTEVAAVEPDPTLRGAAERASRAVRAPVVVMDGVAEDLPFPNGSFDVVVLANVLCTLPDVQKALDEVARVLRPGGLLRFLEHVASSRPGRASVQRIAETFWPLVAGGCHVTRDTVTAIETAGYSILECEKLTLPLPLHLAPLAPHALGIAVPPSR